VAIKITVLWVVPPRSLVAKCQQFGWTFCPLPRKRGVFLQNSAICSYILVYTKVQDATLAFSGTDAMILNRWMETLVWSAMQSFVLIIATMGHTPCTQAITLTQMPACRIRN
jgi:hypothetical protein